MAISPDTVARAERLSRKRATLVMVLPLFLWIHRFANGSNPAGTRAIDHVHHLAWLILAAVLLYLLVTGGFVFRARGQVRALINDEGFQANRARALGLGFLAAMLAAFVVALAIEVAPGAILPMEAVQLVVSCGLTAGLIRLGMLERRALG